MILEGILVPQEILSRIAEYSIGQNYSNFARFSGVCHAFRDTAFDRFALQVFREVLETDYTLKSDEVTQVLGDSGSGIEKINRVAKTLREASTLLTLSLKSDYVSPAAAKELQTLYKTNRNFSKELHSRFLRAFTKATVNRDIIQAKLILSHGLIQKIGKRQRESYIRKIKMAADCGNKSVIRDLLASNIYMPFKKAHPKNRNTYFRVLRTELEKAAGMALMRKRLDILKLLLETNQIYRLGQLLYLAVVTNQIDAIKEILLSSQGGLINAYGEVNLTTTLMVAAENGFTEALSTILASPLGSILPSAAINVALQAAKGPNIVKVILEYKQNNMI